MSMQSNDFRSFRCQDLGFTLIEIVLGISMLLISFLSISTYYVKVLNVSQDTTRHIQSSFLLEEGLEAAKLLRDKSWSTNIASLSTTTTYYFYWSGTMWTATKTPQLVENVFTRSFRVTDVNRDAFDDIAPAGTYDAGTKKITVNVTWPRRSGRTTATDTAETYITNLFGN